MTARDLDRDSLARMPLPPLGPDSDKEARGSVLVVAGGAQVPGAAVLTGLAALRVGAGKLKIAVPSALAIPLGVALPEAAVIAAEPDETGELGPASESAIRRHLEHCDALVVGPGMMGEGAHTLGAALEAAGSAAVVLDAGVLSPGLARAGEGDPKRILTPHAGEMASLLEWPREVVTSDPASAALEAARRFAAVVIMKGETSYVADPEGALWRHVGGVVGLGTSGSGDVLAGAISGFLARGATPLAAALRGVFVHAEAGRHLTDRVGKLGFLAREILDALPAATALSER